MIRGALAGGVLLALAACAVAAQDLGRLFTTPEERLQLDEVRRVAQLPKPEVEVEPPPPPVVQARAAPEAARPVVDRLTINGVVRRSGGRSTVWVNGDEVERGSTTREGIRVQDSGRTVRNIRIQLPSGADTIELKPGQEIDVATGMVLESYERQSESGSGRSAFSPSHSGRDGEAPGVTSDPAADADPDADASGGIGGIGFSPAAIADLPVAEKAAALARLRELADRAGAGAGAPVARP